VVASQPACLKHGGIYKGDGVPCTATTCEPIGQTGACCLPNGGGCIQSTDADCRAVGGAFLGPGTPCTATTCPNTLPEGCCCLADGTCIATTKLKCDLAGGSYAGNGVPCSGFLKGTQCCIGLVGNVDGDETGGVDISDLSNLIDGLYISLTPFPCDQAADVDNSGNIDISDLSTLIDFLYINFTPLPPCL